jgi:transcriptional regulator with XRE-family HTH domain
MSSAAQFNIAKSTSQLRRDARTLQAFMALKAQEIGERISQLRDAKGNPPQPRVAAAVGVSLRTYQAWEGGTARPQYHNLEALAEYFGTTEEYILTGAQPGVPPRVIDGVQYQFKKFDAQDIGAETTETPTIDERLSRIEASLERLHARLDTLTPLLPGVEDLLQQLENDADEAGDDDPAQQA